MLAMMERHGISQLPVIEDGHSVGSVREHRVMSQLLEDRSLLDEAGDRGYGSVVSGRQRVGRCHPGQGSISRMLRLC
jgi:predicted transcriptional regulator